MVELIKEIIVYRTDSGGETLCHKRKEKKSRKRRSKKRVYIIFAIELVILLVLGILVLVHSSVQNKNKFDEPANMAAAEIDSTHQEAEEETDDLQPIIEPEIIDIEKIAPDFVPYCTEATDPDSYIEYTEVQVDGNILDSVSAYSPAQRIEFGLGSEYTEVEGIVSFRGDNFRNTPSYGYAEMTDYTLQGIWSKGTGSLTYGDHTWTGSGWTGQPLMMKWPKETKVHMNMYDWAKDKDDLVEVIYACLDGYIYFLDLESGEPTRDSLRIGYAFKGSGALDPRGYPIMYVGAGYDSNEGKSRVFIINLLDCSVMYTFGNADSFSLRGSLSYFDSSALVDAETDTLIYPGENGILYLMKLNTDYNESAGTLTISPGNIVKWRYYGTRSSSESYWVGMETSAAVYKGYLFITDNGANLTEYTSASMGSGYFG